MEEMLGKPKNSGNRIYGILGKTSLFVGAFLCVNYFCKKMYRKIRKYPFGPVGLPYIGCLIPFIFNQESFLKKQGKLNEITLFSVGIYYTGVINSTKLLHQLWRNEDACLRSPYNGTPMLTVSNDEWQLRRKIQLKSVFVQLNKHFVNKTINDSLIKHVFNRISQNNLYYCRSDMKYCAFNTLFFKGTGKVIDINDELYIKMSKYAHDWMNIFYDMMVVGFVPKLIYLYKHNGILNRFINVETELMKCIKDIISISKNNKNKNVVTFIDEILNDNTYDRKELIYADILNVFVAGIDTSSLLSEFALFMLGKETDLQQNIYLELVKLYNNDKNEINGYKCFNLDWIHECHIFRAFIHECLRLGKLTPTAVPHFTGKSIKIKLSNNEEYIIPKNTLLMPNYFYMLTDKDNSYENWIEPKNKLNINNFLSNNKFKLHESFVAFSYGKRDCIGKSLAMKHIYTVIGTFILNYQINLLDKNVEIQFEGGLTQSLKPQHPFKMIKR